jgi:hypothetical protein
MILSESMFMWFKWENEIKTKQIFVLFVKWKLVLICKRIENDRDFLKISFEMKNLLNWFEKTILKDIFDDFHWIF